MNSLVTVSTCPVTIDLSRYQPQYALTEYIHPAEKDRQLAEQCAEQNRQLAEKDRQILDIYNSQSWKATAPMRKVLGFFKK